MLRFKKALLASAFFVALTATPVLASDCSPPQQSAEQTRVASIIDGDTVKLTDGRRVRLIGINTPEIGHDGAADEPLAQAASQRLRQLIDRQPIQLYPGQGAQDHHGRTLAHLFNSTGQSIEAALLRDGLAFRVAVAPNLALQDCFAAAEAQAEQLRKGVWSQNYYSARRASTLGKSDTGFRRIQGRVTAAGRNRSGLYLELDQTLYLPVSRSAEPFFDESALTKLQGQQVEVRGWLKHRQLSDKQRQRHYRSFVLNLSHPSMIEHN